MNAQPLNGERVYAAGLRPFTRLAVYKSGARIRWSVEFHSERPADQAEAWGHWTWEDASHEH